MPHAEVGKVAMKLKPVRDYPEQAYPRASDRLVKGLFLAVTMTATSLGGCGPLGNEYNLDSAVETYDLGGTVDAPAPDKGEANPAGVSKGEANLPDVFKSEASPPDIDRGEATSRESDGK